MATSYWDESRSAGDSLAAGKYLVEAAHTPGSPQLNSFGPNVTLAKELLEMGLRRPCSNTSRCARTSGKWTADNSSLERQRPAWVRPEVLRRESELLSHSRKTACLLKASRGSEQYQLIKSFIANA